MNLLVVPDFSTVVEASTKSKHSTSARRAWHELYGKVRKSGTPRAFAASADRRGVARGGVMSTSGRPGSFVSMELAADTRKDKELSKSQRARIHAATLKFARMEGRGKKLP